MRLCTDAEPEAGALDGRSLIFGVALAARHELETVLADRGLGSRSLLTVRTAGGFDWDLVAVELDGAAGNSRNVVAIVEGFADCFEVDAAWADGLLSRLAENNSRFRAMMAACSPGTGTHACP